MKQIVHDKIGDALIFLFELPVVGAVLGTLLGVVGALLGRDPMGEVARPKK